VVSGVPPTDRQTARHTALFGRISTAEINGTKICIGGQRQHPVRAGGLPGIMRVKELRPYLEQKGTTTNLIAHTDKLLHKIIINVTTKEINQGIKKTEVQISKRHK
jgi:hypothetical protein